MSDDVVRFLFKRIGDGPDLRFVEVEDGKGNSVNVGQWSEHEGYAVLTISKSKARGLSSEALTYFDELDGTPNDLQAIRMRAIAWPGGLDPNDPLTPFGEACNDRATLLKALAAERARRVEVEAKLENAYAAIHRQIDEIHPVRVTDEQIATLTKD